MYFHFAYLQQQGPSEFLKNKAQWLYEWENDNNEGEDFKILGCFSKINLFVGSNNSGKSRFLRGLLKSSEDFSLRSQKRKFLSRIFNEFKSSYNELPRDSKNKYVESYNNIKRQNSHYELVANYNTFKSVFVHLRDEKVEFLKEKKEKHHLLRNELRDEKILNYLNSALELEDEILFLLESKPKTKKYIPTLRSVHVNNFLQKNSISETIKKNYGIEKDIFTGLSLFDIVFDLKNSPGPNRKKIKRFEEFLSIHFFDDKNVEITSNKESTNILLSIDEDECPLHDIGDGIQSLITLLFPIFIANENDWFFIEEPEINLHPGLQRIFVEALLNDEYLKSKNLRYFFTTHSNHIMDITLNNDEISIFQFEKSVKGKFLIKNNIKPSKETLDLLGVKNSSVFLANTSIWVEGPSDRKYVSKFLNIYAKFLGEPPLKEDIDFAFFEYGGNLIKHYLFDPQADFDEVDVRDKINTFSLSNKIYLLADNDNVDKRSSKGKRRRLLEENMNNNSNFLYQNTELKEIENLLPKKIIKDFLFYLVKNLKNNDSIESIDFNKGDYDKIGMGDFYEELLLRNKIPKKYHKAFKAESGTLKNEYKMKLVDLVISSNYDFEDYINENPTLNKIVSLLYEFVKK